jgi:uncharacterized protein YecT (DUF1311 family)
MAVKLMGMVASVAVILVMAQVPFAQSQKDMQNDACNDYRKVDSELNSVYQRILSEYREDKEFLDKLKKAQKAWLSYRDAHVESVYPAKDKKTEYGSMYEACLCTVQKDMTIQRTEILNLWLRGVPEGDVCSGSAKSAN